MRRPPQKIVVELQRALRHTRLALGNQWCDPLGQLPQARVTSTVREAERQLKLALGAVIVSRGDKDDTLTFRGGDACVIYPGASNMFEVKAKG